MVPTSGNTVSSGDRKEEELVSTSRVLVRDPQMVQISLYEIKHFLTIATWAKVVTIIGSLLVGGVLSAVFSKIPVHPCIVIASLAMFVVGIFLDVYFRRTKLRELERKGSRTWR